MADAFSETVLLPEIERVGWNFYSCRCGCTILDSLVLVFVKFALIYDMKIVNNIKKYFFYKNNVDKNV